MAHPVQFSLGFKRSTAFAEVWSAEDLCCLFLSVWHSDAKSRDWNFNINAFGSNMIWLPTQPQPQTAVKVGQPPPSIQQSWWKVFNVISSTNRVLILHRLWMHKACICVHCRSLLAQQALAWAKKLVGKCFQRQCWETGGFWHVVLGYEIL